MNHYISIISPIRNEEKYIANCLVSLVNQDYNQKRYEILIIDGMSTDNTRQIVKRYKEKYKNIRLFNNPNKTVPFALNVGIRQAKGNVIVRVDGHAEIEADYLSQCVNYLHQTNAECVGGCIESINDTYIGKAIALAMSSQFGVGNARFRTNGKEGYVDCLAFGAYRREVFDRIGCFNEEFVRCQDDEFNYRLRKFGGKIFFTPKIRSYYYSRSNLKKLWRQYFQYGFWKIRVMQLHLSTMQPRQFVPPAFILTLILTGLSVFFSNTLFAIFLFVTGLYLIFSLTAATIICRKNGFRYMPVLPIVFFILHTSYGLGFLLGIFAFLKNWIRGKNSKRT
jgi:glycosyltransferase involved in cell wall biosynthesis